MNEVNDKELAVLGMKLDSVLIGQRIILKYLSAIGGIEVATQEQLDALTQSVAALQNGENVEEGQLRDIVAALQSANTTADPAIDAAIVGINHVADSLAAFPGTLPSAPAPTPAPATPPVDSGGAAPV